MRVTRPVVLGVAALLGLGLTTAAAADAHGDAVSAAAKAAKSLIGEARGDAVSAVANTKVVAGAALAATATTTRNAHGVAVSSIARNQDTTAAHTTGAMKTNHGGAVSAAAQKR